MVLRPRPHLDHPGVDRPARLVAPPARAAQRRLLLTYGDLSGTFGPGRPTVGRILKHPERDITARRDVLIYDAVIHGPATADQANPSSVELRPNRYFTITSDPHIASIVGVYTEKRDYLG